MLTKNLETLKEKHPRIAASIRNVSTPDERRFITNDKNIVVYQHLYHDKWNCLTSAYDPMHEAERQILNPDISEAKFVFVLGEAGLYHVEALMSHVSSDTVVLLISNSFANLRLVFETRDLTKLLEDDRFYIIADDNLTQIKQMIHTMIQSDLYTIPAFAIVEHPIEALCQDEFFFQIKKFFHAIFTTSVANRNTTIMFEHWWSRNLLRNLPFLLTAKTVGELSGSWENKPAIVVGAGPSLNKNIHLLKELKGKAMIICVDTAFRILERHGIKPDVLVTLDGSPMNAAHLKGCNYADIPILFDAYSHYEILVNHKGPRIALSTVEYHQHWWSKVVNEEINRYSITQGGSVATAAFSFARILGADPIVLTGVDLSYPQGQCYASGALHESRTLKDSDRQLYPVTDIYGEPTYTTFDYLFYLRWFIEQGKDNAGRKYINATEGGALRDNFTVQPLAEVIAEYCTEEFPIEKWVLELKNHSIEKNEILRVRRQLQRGRTELRAASRFLMIMMHKLETYIKKVHDYDYVELNNLLLSVEKGNKKLSLLHLAMAFMDCHSFDAIYTDIRIDESVKREQRDYTENERTLIFANKSFNLFTDFYNIAIQSVQMHTEGIKAFDTVFNSQLEEVHQ